jgi:uncharacterized membrane protein
VKYNAKKNNSLFEFFYSIEMVDVLLTHDQTLIQHSYRAAIIASRLGKDYYYFDLPIYLFYLRS